jgi:MFS family permease
VLGGWLIQHASWRWIFFINIPLAVAVIVISLWRVPESRSPDQGRVDWLGAFVVTVGLGGLVFGFLESANLGWRNPLVVAALIVGFGCLAVFPFVEKRSSSPMVPLSLFASASFTGANLVTLFLYAAIGIFFFLFPLDLIQVQGYSATQTGAAVLPLILLMFFLSRWSGGLVARYGARLPLIVGPLFGAVGFLLFAIPSVGGNYWRTFFLAIVVLGIGMAITVAPLTTVVMNSAGEERVGAASGINNAVARVAGVLAVAVLGIVMVNAFSSHLNRDLARISLPPEVLRELQANKIKLAGLPIPNNLNPSTKAAVKESIDDAFIFGFRIVILICAGLAIASSAVAALMIPKSVRES